MSERTPITPPAEAPAESVPDEHARQRDIAALHNFINHWRFSSDALRFVSRQMGLETLPEVQQAVDKASLRQPPDRPSEKKDGRTVPEGHGFWLGSGPKSER